MPARPPPTIHRHELPPRPARDADHRKDGRVTSIIGRAPIEGQAESHDEGGPEGNERLTAGTGALLLVLYAIEGVTILFLGQLLTAHFFVGFLLIGPVALKLASTGYRFFRYYTGHPVYKRKGPPMPLLRILGPFVVLTSVTVLATGVALGLVGPNASVGPFPMLFLHKASFVLWGVVTGIHVLAYIWRLPRLIGADLRRRDARHGSSAPGRGKRWAVLGLALGAGLVMALAGMHLSSGWANYREEHHRDRACRHDPAACKPPAGQDRPAASGATTAPLAGPADFTRLPRPAA